MLKTEKLLFKIYFYGYIKRKMSSDRGYQNPLVIFLAKENWGDNSSEEKAV